MRLLTNPRFPSQADHAQEAEMAPYVSVAPRQRQYRLTTAEAQELVAARVAGATINDLADRFQVHRTTVMSHLSKAEAALHHLA